VSGHTQVAKTNGTLSSLGNAPSRREEKDGEGKSWFLWY
jgi:hypothetical protein